VFDVWRMARQGRPLRKITEHYRMHLGRFADSLQAIRRMTAQSCKIVLV
jgi:hypothetical protein